MIAGLSKPVGLHANHFYNLPPASDQVGQCLAFCIGNWARFRANALCKEGDDLGTDRISFGKSSDRAGEIADLTRSDNGEWECGTRQCGCHGDFEAARSLKHDQRRS
jgi:hypothetical protein